ncbi:MAG: GTPase ObgE [Gaiellales bacterium]
MFSDRATIHVAAGRGGDGSVAFRREKYVPRGGPSGGDGGDGGSIVLVADSSLRDLTAVRHHPHIRAADGRGGEGSNRTGATGDDTIVPVPVGTQVLDEEDTMLVDLARPGASAVIAHGGRGGAGNRRFRTAVRQAPRTAELGGLGEELTLVLQLKLPADAALLGFPNIGKSSLLRRVSNAKPKVADYPFTTIEPVLGVVDLAVDRQITVMDVPGLLEGAAEGHGLGLDFLAHLERARLLLHVVDAGLEVDEAVAGFVAIHGELERYQEDLATRPRIVVLNRIDLIPDEDRAARIAELTAALDALGDAPAMRDVVRDASTGAIVLVPVSCATGEGVPELIGTLARVIPEPEPEPEAEERLAQYLVYRPGRSGGGQVRVLRDETGVRMVGTPIEDDVQRATEERAEELLRDYVEERRLAPLLVRAGAKKGIVVKIGAREVPFRV